MWTPRETDEARAVSSFAPAFDVDHDRYCIGCGYNLRGLAGDPVRCPECGRDNSRRELDLPAHLVTRQLRQMESASAYSVMLFMTLGLLTVVLPVQYALGLATRWTLPAFGLAYILTAGGYCAALWSSRRSCENHPAWRGAIVTYHVFGVLMLLGAAAIVVAAGMTIAVVHSFVFNPIVIIALAAGAIVLWTRFTYARATGRLRGLQRDVAVRVAVRELARLRDRGEYVGP